MTASLMYGFNAPSWHQMVEQIGQEGALRIIDGLNQQEQQYLDQSWEWSARPEQLAPAGDWPLWMFMGGRGSGKTRAGAEWCLDRIRIGARRLMVMAPTYDDLMEVCFEGLSGIITCAEKRGTMRDIHSRPFQLAKFVKNEKAILFSNGARVKGYSADKEVRGPQADSFWADEVVNWRPNQPRKMVKMWDAVQLGVRLPVPNDISRTFVSTTPKFLPLIIRIHDKAVKEGALTTGSSYRNRANLDPAFYRKIIEDYEGTSIGEQELHGKLVAEAEGALWTLAMIDATRVRATPDPGIELVIAVDPAVTTNQASSETGIVVCAACEDDHGYVLADFSGKYTVHKAAEIISEVYREFEADGVVVETNQGGDWAEEVLVRHDPSIVVHKVHTKRGKKLRAEPVARLFQKRQAHIVGHCPDLEAQMVSWVPGETTDSPDRVDAMVHGIHHCVIKRRQMSVQRWRG